uniref:Glycosyl transferase family 28 C-terminal domain-containing protein n=1 Tax=Ananas comosus var. bracteatus TaxID=296719 RepID=A0A6V7Q827_ANACO|nr:unnamed protein product [Ananas comosus var. bracteatus]
MGGGGDNGDGESRRRRIVFVTVGTTCFNALVEAVDSEKVKEALWRKGFTHLLIQMGCGTYIPSKVAAEDRSIAVDYFTFSPSIADFLRSASLIINHAGSGSIFETLRFERVSGGTCSRPEAPLLCPPQTLCEIIDAMDLESLVPYMPGDALPVASLGAPELMFPIIWALGLSYKTHKSRA